MVDLTCISLTNLSSKKHIIKVCHTVHFKLIYIMYIGISSICRFFTEDAAKTPTASCIISRLDYCNCLLMGTPNSPLQFQKIQNFAARLILLAPCTITQHLLEKHWLPISEHIKQKEIKYKVACMCFSAINGSGPAYL